jgi:hypothetical protein
MNKPNDKPDPDQAGVSPEIGRAEIAHLFQSGALPSRALAEALDALATGGIEELEEANEQGAEGEPATVVIPETAKTYRALRLGLPPELQTIQGFYLIMGDAAIELVQLDRDGRPPAGRVQRWLWVRAMARKMRTTLKKFLADCYDTKGGEEDADGRETGA